MFGIRVQQPGSLDGVIVSEGPDPVVPAGWTLVQLRAASINAADFAAVAGDGWAAGNPVVLGSDGTGVTAGGREVILYPAIAGREFSDATLDPRVRLLGHGINGTFATHIAVPDSNLIDKPPTVSWETAATLGTAWLTAYRMLTSSGHLVPGQLLLVQGAGGGVATALIILGRSLGARVWVVARDPQRRARAVDELGAERAFSPDERLPERVDLVGDSVGAATLASSLAAVRAGGRVVVSGAASGSTTRIDLSSLFLRNVSLIGSTLGSRDELVDLASFISENNIQPAIDSTWNLAGGAKALDHALRGRAFGKVLLDISA